ncbi:MAG: diguanylate cyclase, partial [Mycobacterium sp.]|nr:diguanylate cyclase [Mycobacterium sp.]
MAGVLDDLVTAAAAELMAATAGNSASASQRVVRNLVSHLGVDFGFLRHNDHTIHATVLIAEWPPRENVPEPDPIGVLYFDGADPVFARAENLKAPDVLCPDTANADYQSRIEEGRGIPAVSLACVPLLSGHVTTGTLGFIKFGDREWLPEELSALQAIATLFAQLQARIVAEEQLQYLVEHDDLTGLLNRRAVISHLDGRLAEGKPGPVSVLYLDVDRLKVINDHLGHSTADRFLKAFADLLCEAGDIPSVICRFTGDEFVVVPTEPMDVEGAETFAQRLQNRVRQQVEIDGEMLSRSVSIGVAVGVPGRE